MKVVVPIKRVADYNARVRIKADKSDVDRTNIKMSMNPFDEIAVEEAVRLKESGAAAEVVAVSIGPREAEQTIRTALAMGADRGILIETTDVIEPLTAAKILRAICTEEQPGLVIAGKQAIDSDCGQTGPMLAGLLGWAQATHAYKLEIRETGFRVTCECDNGLQVLDLKGPAVITTDLRLNEPRYVSLPNLMKAKKKPVDIRTPADYGIETTPRLTIVRVDEPAPRAAGINVTSVAALIDALEARGVLQ